MCQPLWQSQGVRWGERSNIFSILYSLVSGYIMFSRCHVLCVLTTVRAHEYMIAGNLSVTLKVLADGGGQPASSLNLLIIFVFFSVFIVAVFGTAA